MNFAEGLYRIRLLRSQLLSGKNNNSKLLEHQPKTSLLDKFYNLKTFNEDTLRKVYFPFNSHFEFRQKIFDIMKQHTEFRDQTYQIEITSSDLKDLVTRRMKILVKEIDKIIPFKEIRNDPVKFGILLEAVTHYDLGLSVRFAFHSVLYYNSLRFLGTDYHQEFIERNLNLDDIGCFGLTECGHGSNVRSMQTIATFDDKTNEFILHSPSYDAYKWWIGGAGATANMGIIFAQLYTKGQCHGIHAFLVSLRNRFDNMPHPGVFLGDTGPKIGNEAVDNGFIGFFHYRVPRKALLDRFSQVNKDGTFSSQISNPDVRFATALGALSEGRVGVCLSSQVRIAHITFILDSVAKWNNNCRKVLLH
jgi:acyl-CoA oxidase